MKKLLSLFMTVIMVVSVGVITPIFADDAQLIIHYQRDDGSYDDWNLWIWSEGGEGTVYPFEYEDDYGVVAVISLPDDTSRFGFIVRTDDWDKDVATDRYVDLNSGIAEIWVMSGEEEFLINPPANFLPFNANGSTIDSNTNDSTNTIEPAVAEDLTVRVHYHRYDGNYNGWNLWLWPEGADGSAYEFNDLDDFGAVADIVLPDASLVNNLGFIVRLNDWEAKDVDSDRYMKVSKMGEDGILDVYLVQADAAIYYAEEDVDLSPSFMKAELETMSTLAITVTVPFAANDTTGLFELKTSDGGIITVTDVTSEDGEWINNANLTLSEPLVLGSNYTLTSPTYGDIGIAMTKAFDLEAFNDVYYYDGNDLGAIYTKESTSFRLWAPTASSVSLKLYSEGSGDTLLSTHEMTSDVKGTWITTIKGDFNGTYYTYEVTTGNQSQEAVDPYAKAVGVNGDRGMVIDLPSTNPINWDEDTKPELINFTDAIVYELHIRDLSTSPDSGIENVGKYLGLTETGTVNNEGISTGLDHIIDLGVTHVQLLPVFDFRTIDETTLDTADFNWGYDPENYNSPEGSYSTDPYDGAVRINEFKTMVQTLHENDLRVIMDVVYNHTGASVDSSLNKIVPNYYYRTDGDTFSNGSGCGNETASERAMVRKMIVDSVVYWAREYHIDGFRFDLMGLHDQETMQAVRDALSEIDSTIIIYGEGWTGGTSPLPDDEKCLKINTLNLEGIGAFSDDIRDGIKGHVFEPTTPGFVNGGSNMEESVKFGIVGATEHDQIDYLSINYSDTWWANSPSQSINYAEAHDNLTLWDKLSITNPTDSDETLIKMDLLSASIFLTSQGIPFIHAGMEFLRTKNGEDNSYNLSDEINQLDWSRKSEYLDVYTYYQGLIDLRQAHPAFRMITTQEIQNNLFFFGMGDDYGDLQLPSENMVGYMITNHANGDEAGTIIVLFNATRSEKTVSIPEGEWSVVVNANDAGTETLTTLNDSKVTISGISALILTSPNVIDPTKITFTGQDTSANTSLEPKAIVDSKDINKKPPIGLVLGIIGGVGALVAGIFYYKKKK